MKWLKNLYNRIKLEIAYRKAYRKKVKEIRKKDPYVYK
jgi:hypothetical protein